MALTKEQILNAWKDEEYRNTLPAEDRDSLPERPTAADGSQLTDEQLEEAAGGSGPWCIAASYVGSAAASAAVISFFD